MPDFEDYIRYASDHGFIDIMINTNATLLTEERARSILDCGLTRLRFSLDAASPETYRKIRGRDYYSQVIKNIEAFLDLKERLGYKLPITGVNFCKMSLNEHEADKFVEFWEDKVDMVTMQAFAPLVAEKELDVLYPTIQEGDIKQFRCAQPFQRVVIRNNGIYPCCFISNDLVVGDLREDTIYRAWNSEKMGAIREVCRTGQYHKNKSCKACVGLLFPQTKEL